VDYIRNFLANPPSSESYTGVGIKYVMDTYNVPIWVTAMGAYRGFEDDSEYEYFKNTLTVLNEWEVSYCAYQWFRSDLPWYIGWHEPNRVGQALIDAIAELPPTEPVETEKGSLIVTAEANNQPINIPIRVVGDGFNESFVTPANVSLPIGNYFIYAEYENKTKVKQVAVIPNETRFVNFDFSQYNIPEPYEPSSPSIFERILKALQDFWNWLIQLFRGGG